MERLRPERSWSEIHASYDQKKCRSHPIHRKVRPTGLPQRDFQPLDYLQTSPDTATKPPNLRSFPICGQYVELDNDVDRISSRLVPELWGELGVIGHGRYSNCQ